MPVLSVAKTRALHPAGLFTFTLAGVETIQMKSFDGTGQVERLIWRFVSGKKDAEGAFLEVAVFTGFSYGHPNARLTWLLDMVRPGITKRDADQLDTETLVGTRYEGQVKHVASEEDADKKLCAFTYLRPVDMPADPFVDGNAGAVNTEPPGIEEVGDAVCQWEGCEEVLTLKEIESSIKRWGSEKRFCSVHGKKQIASEKASEDAFAE